jgi:Flp pilus assembly protein TadB
MTQEDDHENPRLSALLDIMTPFAWLDIPRRIKARQNDSGSSPITLAHYLFALITAIVVFLIVVAFHSEIAAYLVVFLIVIGVATLYAFFDFVTVVRYVWFGA